jgi:hypothetical protein
MDKKTSPNSETEVTPPLDAADTSFLKQLNNDYMATEVPRLHVDKFKAYFLPHLARDQGAETNRAALLMWEKEVAKNTRLPVYIVDDNDTVIYTVPPLTGTGPTRFTGNLESIDSKLQNVAAIRNRFNAQGDRAMEDTLRSIPTKDVAMTNYRLEWYRILVDFGYMEPLAGVKLTGLTAAGKGSSVDDDEPEFVDDDD